VFKIICNCSPVRRKKADQRGEGLQSSPNLPSTSAIMASRAAWESGPCASTRISSPGAAASIISPMIDVPFTSSPPSRDTVITASYWLASVTNFALARACRPRLLRISRYFGPEFRRLLPIAGWQPRCICALLLAPCQQPRQHFSAFAHWPA